MQRIIKSFRNRNQREDIHNNKKHSKRPIAYSVFMKW